MSSDTGYAVDDEDDTWSDSLEEPYGSTVTIEEYFDDGERTPHVVQTRKDFTMDDLMSVSGKLSHIRGQQRDIYGYPIIVEKETPVLSRPDSRASLSSRGSGARKRNKAPQPPLPVTAVEPPMTYRNPFEEEEEEAAAAKNESENEKLVIKEKSRPMSFLSSRRTPSPRNDPSSKCPHCTIHSWLPHSPGCTKFPMVKKPSKK